MRNRTLRTKPGDIMDSDGNVAPGSAMPKLKQFIQLFPEVVSRSTDPEMYLALKKLGVTFPE